MKLTISRINKGLLFFVLLGTFFLILYKALFIPITHDEVATLYLVRDSSFSDILFYTDPDQNNHILNSLLTKISIQIFDIHLWSIRLPNLLFFSFFSIGVWRIVKGIFGFKSYFVVAAGLIFVANPYMLDFLSLCRGYGMSIALTTLSISFLLSFYKTKNIKYTHLTLITACLASYANFSLVYFLAATIFILALGVFLNKNELEGKILKNTTILIFTFLAYAALVAIPLKVILTTNQMIYWESDGFLENTLFPLVENSLSGSKTLFLQEYYAVGVGVIIIIVLGTLYILRRVFNSENRKLLIQKPIFVSTTLLIATIAINLFHCYVLGAPFLNGRIAIFYHPLFMFMLLSIINLPSWNYSHNIKLTLSIITITLTSIHFSQTWKKDVFREWYYDATTYEVIAYLDAIREGKTITIDTHWLFNPAFRFHIEYDNINWLKLKYYNKEILPNTNSDYYYIMWDEEYKIESNFKSVLRFQTGGTLMSRIQ